MFNNYYQEFSKKDKAIIRELLDKGIEKEFEAGLKEAEEVLAGWQRDKSQNGETFRKLYSTITNFNKHIARRYDGMGGSMYVPVVGMQLRDNVLTEEDIAPLSDEAKARVRQFASLL